MKKLTQAAVALTLVAVVAVSIAAFAAEKATDAKKPAATAATKDVSGCPMHSGGTDAAMASSKDMAGCGGHGSAASAKEGCSKGMAMGAGSRCETMGAGSRCGTMAAGRGRGPMGAMAMDDDMECGVMCAEMGMGGESQAMMGCMPGGGRGRMGAMLHSLDLTPEQQKKVEAAHEKAQRAAIQAQADLQVARLDLQNLLRADHPDKVKIDAQIDKLARLRAGLQKTHVQALLEVRSVLTPEQVQKLHATDMTGEDD
jgi:Spy/CpxP family protein refolding chaperone